jgi:hypothetical protein
MSGNTGEHPSVLKNPTFLPLKTTKLLLLMLLKKQPFGLVPIPKKFTYPNPLKKTSFGKRWNYPIVPSSHNKNPFENKIKILTPHPFFKKLHLQLAILSI